MFIREVKLETIKNSRGEPTVSITLKTFEGAFTSSAPSGKSTGSREVASYNTKGIRASMKRLLLFSKKYLHEQNYLIKKLDDLKILNDNITSFENKYGKLGGNVTYTLQTAILKAAAADNQKELWQFIHDSINKGKKKKLVMPMPVGNCIGGGAHSTLIKGKKPDFQEFLLIPNLRNEKTFSKAITTNLKAYERAKTLLKAHKRNDENAWMTDKTNEEVLEILGKVAKQYKVRIGLDIAASSFYDKGYYHYKNKELIRDKVDQQEYMTKLITKHNIFYVEDPCQENDFSGYKQLLATVSEKKRSKTLIVGDDLTTTHIKDVARAARGECINAMIVKPNQVGDMLEVAKVVEFCKKNRITMIFSHRSGETMDDALADYAIGFGADFIKSGIYGKERLIKHKRIIDIEKSLE